MVARMAQYALRGPLHSIIGSEGGAMLCAREIPRPLSIARVIQIAHAVMSVKCFLDGCFALSNTTSGIAILVVNSDDIVRS